MKKTFIWKYVKAKEGYKGTKAEMDYENVAMLSSNIGLDNMNHVIKLVREADDLEFDKIDKTKVEKVIELQRIRGGWFESFVACRLPWVEVNLSLDYYPKFTEAITGMKYSFENLNRIADRIYALIRAFWVREYGYWTRNMDMPPMRWFEEPLTKGPKKGAHLDIDAYNKMLDTYYEIRGWDENGIPKLSTFNSLGLSQEARELQSLGIKLTI